MIQFNNIEKTYPYQQRIKLVKKTIIPKLIHECDKIIENGQKQLKVFSLPITVSNEKLNYEYIINRLSKVYYLKNILSEDENIFIKYDNYNPSTCQIDWCINEEILDIIKHNPKMVVKHFINADELVYPRYMPADMGKLFVGIMDIALHRNKEVKNE